MDLKTGLGGHAVSGQPTEIKIQLFASHPIAGELEIIDANGHTKLPIQLDEQREQTLWIPVTAIAYTPIRVRLITHRGDVIEKELAFEHSDIPLTIIASTIPAGQTLNSHHAPAAITPVILATAGLPHTPQAYAGVDAIVIDPQSLSSLSQDQYHALADYLGQCNIMLLSGSNQVMLEELQKIAGCGGRFIQRYEDITQVTPALLKLSAMRPPKTPAPQELMLLWQPAFQQQMITSISLYLGGYLFFMALITWRMKSTYYLLLLPAITAAAGALIWTGEGSHHLTSWAETESGDSYNRISSLLTLGGNRQGENSTTFGTDSRLSNFTTKSQPPGIHYLQDSAQRKLSGHTHLLSPQAYHLTSISRQPPLFLLTMKKGRPEVFFQGEESPADTRLLWRGHFYNVPVMSRNQRWQPEQTPGLDPASPAERLLNRHLAFGYPALLLPLSPYLAEAVDKNIQTTGWLVIRHNPEQML